MRHLKSITENLYHRSPRIYVIQHSIEKQNFGKNELDKIRSFAKSMEGKYIESKILLYREEDNLQEIMISFNEQINDSIYYIYDFKTTKVVDDYYYVEISIHGGSYDIADGLRGERLHTLEELITYKCDGISGLEELIKDKLKDGI